jgi:hypothetical protein
VAHGFAGTLILGSSNLRILNLFALTFLLSLCACSSGPSGVRVVNGGTSAIPKKAGAPIRNLGSSEVSQAVVGKNFQYTRKDGTGFVTYNADGSLTITDDQKGAIQGTWKMAGDQYCETYGPTALECGVFKSTGDAFFAANSRLVEMKI